MSNQHISIKTTSLNSEFAQHPKLYLKAVLKKEHSKTLMANTANPESSRSHSACKALALAVGLLLLDLAIGLYREVEFQLGT